MRPACCLGKLEMVRNQLMECHREIMRVKLKNSCERPILDIKYPKGYEDRLRVLYK